MIAYLRGNLLADDAQALVNTVNTVGVMGKGIALQFKQRFPSQLCGLRPGLQTGPGANGPHVGH